MPTGPSGIAGVIEDARHDSVDDRVLRARLLSEVRRRVPFDAYAFVLTDPESEVGVSPLAEVPDLADLPRLIGVKYRSALGRWTDLGRPPAVSLLDLTGGVESRSPLLDWLGGRYGVRDVLCAVFRDAHGCWAFLDLWRTGGAFGPAEVAWMADQASAVTSALRRAVGDTFTAAPDGPAERGPVAIVLDPELRVRAQTPAARAALAALVPPRPGADPVPAGAYNVAAQLAAVATGVDDHPPWARTATGPGQWVSLRAAPLEGESVEAATVVTVSAATAVERAAVFARAHGLTTRESAVLRSLASGEDTRGLARVLHVTENTVQDHLKAIFRKTGVHARGQLVARVTGSA